MVFKRRIAVFCGSALGLHEDYAVASERLGELIGRQGRTLVFGGCLDGLMAKVALAAHKEGAQICCEFVRGLYQAKDHLPGTVEKVYDHVRERKHGLLADSDACIALPGGMGTLDEFSEVFAAVQLGEIQHPVGFLNVCGYYDPLLAFFDRMRSEAFLSPQWDRLYYVSDDPEALLNMLDQ